MASDDGQFLTALTTEHFGLAGARSVAFLGLATFMRVLENTIEDLLYARAIGRIRQYYVDLAGPERRHFFLLKPGDSVETTLYNMAVRPGHLQVFLTNQAMVSVVNSAVVGAGVAIACGALSASEGLSVAIGVIVMLLCVVLHQIYAQRRLNAGVDHAESLFP